MLQQTRKFTPGGDVWKFDANRRRYDARRKPIYESQWVKHVVVGYDARSYLIRRADCTVAEKVGFARAEREYLLTREKDDDVYRETHANALAERVRGADAGTLRRVAEVLNYEGS